MLKQFIRAFALGLLVASGILAVTYFYFDNPNTTTNTTIDDDTMKEELTKKGYFIYEENMNSHIIDLENQIEMLENEILELNNKENEKETTQPDDDTTQLPDDDITSEENPETVLISIVAGMQAPDVAELLLENEIIEDSNDFIEYIEASDKGRLIQIGNFYLHSNMTIEEIVAIITGG